MGGQRVVLPAELDTCSSGPWTNLVMCIWPGNAAWLHTPVVATDLEKKKGFNQHDAEIRIWYSGATPSVFPLDRSSVFSFHLVF